MAGLDRGDSGIAAGGKIGYAHFEMNIENARLARRERLMPSRSESAVSPKALPVTEASEGILKELKGTLSLERIEVSDQNLKLFAAEYQQAKTEGRIEDLIQRAKEKFPVKARKANLT